MNINKSFHMYMNYLMDLTHLEKSKCAFKSILENNLSSLEKKYCYLERQFLKRYDNLTICYLLIL